MKNSEWIEWNWTEEKPYPETLETRVDIQFRDGAVGINTLVRTWFNEQDEVLNHFKNYGDGTDDITHYRLA